MKKCALALAIALFAVMLVPQVALVKDYHFKDSDPQQITVLVRGVKSGKKSVVKVKTAGKNKYKLKGLKKGKATITVVLASGKKVTCKVKVK